MAVQAHKRRKTVHVSSSDDEGVNSLASSGDIGTVEPGVTDESDEGDLDSGDATPMVSGEGDDGRAGPRPASKQSPQSAPVRPRSEGRDGHNRKGSGRALDRQAGATAYANGTFKSNIFKMQVDELLNQIRPRHGKREASAESALHSIKKTIELLPATKPCSISEAEEHLILSKIAIPFPNPRPSKDVKYKLAYSKPTNINVVGSFVLKTAPRSRDRLEVDLVVTMPKTLFEEKDFINHRYFYKRAHYLARLASGLTRAHGTEFSFNYQLFHDDPLRPILTASPLAKSGEASETMLPGPRWQINIIPCTDQNQFAAAKLRPDKNCLRQGGHGEPKAEEVISDSSPFYNSSLRADMLATAYLKLLHNAAKRCSAFTDACLLGGIWLRQRGFGSSLAAGGFGAFEWSALVALSLHGGGPGGRPLLSEGYSSYQLLKATLQLLAMKDFRKHPLSIGEDGGAPPNSLDDAPVLWDSIRMHNVLFKVSPWAYIALRSEARNTLSMLGDQFYDGFDATFILNVKEPLYRYDRIAGLPLGILSKTGDRNTRSAQECLVRLHEVLKQGLGDRVNSICLFTPITKPWSLGSAPPRSKQEAEVTIAFAENPENVNRTVDHGPAAENKGAAAAFRDFWGEKAELRRFKDGSILESVVWAETGHGTCIIEQITRYLLQRHFGVQDGQILPKFKLGFGDLTKGKLNTLEFQSLMTYFNKFENDLRDLREMPLSIRQIMPADAQLRGSSIHAPPNGRPSQVPSPADVVLQFEGSGRWPDDLAAIQRTKIAFLLKLEEMLQESSDTVFTRIGLENEREESLNQAFLEVTYGAEATFRLRIYHDREQTLFERLLTNPTTDPRSKEEAALGLAKYKRDYVKAPAHTQAVGRLCSRYPALSGSIRLVKKWFSSHLLSNHIAGEVIELLVIHIFVQPWPWQAPSSPQVGFLRTLFWISRWDWRVDPLIVDLSGSGDLKESDIKATQTRFEAWRKLDPALNRVALFTASNVDTDGTTWTDGQPAKVVAGRMTALAKAACAEVEQHQQQLEPASLFSSPLSDFDFVLHVNPEVMSVRSRMKKSDTIFKNLELGDRGMQSIGFEPVEDFVRELELLYGSAVVLFYGASERPIIGGLWSPLTSARSWKVNLAYSTRPSGTADSDDVQALANKTAVLSEIARLGGDLIKRVEVNK